MENSANEAARIIGRSVWRQEFVKGNPEANEDEINDAWKLVRSAQDKIGRRAIEALAKAGYEIGPKKI